MQIAGLGPFRLKEYVPGQRLLLERNPYYWKADKKHQRLPYLDEIVFVFVPSEDAQVVRFEAGDTDVISRLGPDNYAALERDAGSRKFHVYDAGPSLDYNFLVFNLNSVVPSDAPEVRKHQEWFRDQKFRQALSLAIDRDAIVRLIYHGRGTPLWSTVTPANKLWLDAAIPQKARSLEQARALLKADGFSWNQTDDLLDKSGQKVEFSIITGGSNPQRSQMATMIQDDLKHVGIGVQVVPLEFKSMLDRIFNTHSYDTAIMTLGGGDVDPNSQINVWMSNGSSHLWDLGETKPATAWEAKIDQLMNQQLTTIDARRRKKLFDSVQEIAAEQVPILCLAAPHMLVGARESLQNFQPAILDHPTLWNSEQLYFRQ
jgi:peptide/nickel transport system substrate-binding protein